MNNTKVLNSIIDSTRQGYFDDAIADTYLLEGREVSGLAKNARQALKAEDADLALSYLDRCYGR